VTLNGGSVGARVVEHKNRIQSAGSNILAAVNTPEKYLGVPLSRRSGRNSTFAKPLCSLIPALPLPPAAGVAYERGTSGKRVELEAIRQRKGGVRFDVSVVAEGISLGFDQVAAVYLVYRDITERKNAERKLERS
jgi:PAS domain-containing protein